LIPIILVTASSAPENRMKGLEAGADDFLAKPVDRIELIARVRSLLRIKGYTDELERAESVLFALARSIEGKDPYTEGHCERLSVYGEKLGRELGLPPEQIDALRTAGIVHDVGKVAVPDAILLKPAKLTPEEIEVMRKHPVVGEDICKTLKSFKLVLPIIRHHHERRDGTGYPDGLAGDDIPLTARVIQVVDVFDALTTERPYKPALSIEEALDIMQDEVNKGWWDPEIYSTFRRIVLAEGFRLEPAKKKAAS
jgi:putative two-component system response regulator